MLALIKFAFLAVGMCFGMAIIFQFISYLAGNDLSAAQAFHESFYWTTGFYVGWRTAIHERKQ